MNKTELYRLGQWPEEFLDGLVSEVPPIHFDNKMKCTWMCPKHGEYSHTVLSHLNGHRCPRCKNDKGHRSRRDKNPLPQWFLDDLTPQCKELVLLQKVSLGAKLNFICKECGTEYLQIGNHHRDGHNGCPSCKHKTRIKKSQASKRVSNPYPQWFIDEVHPDDREGVLQGRYGVNDPIRFVCPKHGVYSQIIYSHIRMSTGERKCGCRDCAAEISLYGSSLETKVLDYLTSLGVHAYKSKTLIKSPVTGFPMEIDVYCPDYNLAFEVNGLYFHSVQGLRHNKEKYSDLDIRNYHLIKTTLCRDQGVQLIHLWEDDFDNWECLKNVILSKLRLHGYKDDRRRVYARTTKVVEVTTSVARAFYDKYHIQGWGSGTPLALELNGEIVSMMSVRMSAPNTQDKGCFELNRYATKFDTFVIGGYEKLESAFRKRGIKTLISYADKAISDGSLYFKSGWTLVKESEPDYKYVISGKRVHKFNYRIERFMRDPDLEWEPGLTEEQLAALNGIERIYDCGKLKFIKTWQE